MNTLDIKNDIAPKHRKAFEVWANVVMVTGFGSEILTLYKENLGDG